MLRDQLSQERSAHGSELERLKTMQTLVEQQRLQLLQTENQFRMRGIEDIDLMVTTQATFPGPGDGTMPGQGAAGIANPSAGVNLLPQDAATAFNNPAAASV